MLRLTLPEHEVLDPETSTFVTLGGQTVDMEYSLYTVSLWESKWKKPFVESMTKFTPKDEIEWFKCMCVTPDVPDRAWMTLTHDIRKQIYEYMSDRQTATTISRRPGKPGKKQIITSEIIYFWMTQLSIPFECEHWHFNRLMTLIEVGFVKQAGPQKMGAKEAAQLQRDLVAQRRAKTGSRG